MNTRIRTFILTPLFALAAHGAAFAGSIADPHDFASGGQIIGSFTATQMCDSLGSDDDLSVFDAIRGHRIQFTIAFDAIAHEVYAAEADGGKRWILTTTPARVNFYGDQTGYLQHVIAPTLQCAVQIEISEDAAGNTTFDRFKMCEVRAPQYFGFQGGPADASRDDRTPRVQAVGLDTQAMNMQRFGAPNVGMDQTSGPARFLLSDAVPVAVEPRAFGEVKALYRSH